MIIQITPRSLIFILFKRKFAILGFLVATVVLTGLYFTMMGWRFQSQAQLVVNLSSQDLADANLQSSGQAGSAAGSAEGTKTVVGSMAMTAASYDIEKKTVEKIGATRLYPKLPSRLAFGSVEDQAIAKLDSDYDQKVEKDSNSLTLTYINDNPEVAQATLKVLTNLFLQQQASVERNPRKELLAHQLASALEKTSAASRNLLAYRQSVGITDLTTERSLLLNQRDDIQTQLNQNMAALASTQKSFESYKEQLAHIPPTLQLSDQNDQTMRQLDTAKAKLADAEQSLLQATQAYTANSPLLVDARASRDLWKRTYAALKADPTSHLTSGPNPTYQQVEQQRDTAEASLAASEAAVKSWQSRLEAVQHQIDYLNRCEGDIVDLTNQLNVAQTSYQTYLTRTEEARITEDLNRASSASLAVAQEANLPYKPVHFTLVILIALGAGVFGAVGLALALEVYDERLGMPDDVRRAVGLPVLVSLNRVRQPKNGGNGRTRAA
jgi:polysaccharide biosynthesis protein PslE